MVRCRLIFFFYFALHFSFTANEVVYQLATCRFPLFFSLLFIFALIQINVPRSYHAEVNVLCKKLCNCSLLFRRSMQRMAEFEPSARRLSSSSSQQQHQKEPILIHYYCGTERRSVSIISMRQPFDPDRQQQQQQKQSRLLPKSFGSEAPVRIFGPANETCQRLLAFAAFI